MRPPKPKTPSTYGGAVMTPPVQVVRMGPPALPPPEPTEEEKTLEDAERLKTLEEARWEAQAPEREYRKTLEEERFGQRKQLRDEMTPYQEESLGLQKTGLGLRAEALERREDTEGAKLKKKEEAKEDEYQGLVDYVMESEPELTMNEVKRKAQILQRQKRTVKDLTREDERRAAAEKRGQEKAAKATEKAAEIKPLPAPQVDATARMILEQGATDYATYTQAIMKLSSESSWDPRARQILARMVQLKGQIMPKVMAAEEKEKKRLQ
jgi:hypothetical protein